MNLFTRSSALLSAITLTSFIALKDPAFAEILLQPHQKTPVEYLLRHPELKGLLLFHSLGSGKTYISLAYAEKSSHKKVIILVPDFLKTNWTTQMESFGIKDTRRYEIVLLSESEKLLKYDLSNTMVIVDEVHKFVQKIRLGNPNISEKFSNLYQKLKSAQKLLFLSGTPIFVDTSDISYIANLLLEDDPYPVDPLKFKTQYMKIKPVTSLVRGQVTESKLMMLGVPFILTMTAVVTLATTFPAGIPLVALGGAALIPVTNEIFPANQVMFREFDAEKWKDFSTKYVSFFEVPLDENENYPSKQIIEKEVLYNDSQTNFFLGFVDEDMTPNELSTLLKDENETYSDMYLKFHNSKLQKQLLANPQSGLQIGNLDFKNEKDGKIIETPKFYQIFEFIKRKPGQVAVYSNFFTNGIQRFAQFLDRRGWGDQYVLLSPLQDRKSVV